MPPPPAKDDPKALPFEAHLEALEAVVGDLEGDALSLEASIARYQEGVRHLSACRRILDAAEKRLTELVEIDDAGAAVETPLEVGPEGLVDASAEPPAPPLAPPAPASSRSPARSAPKGTRRPAALPPPSSEPGDDLPF